jgi:2-oxoisovalerate dehydrogenase E1 component
VDGRVSAFVEPIALYHAKDLFPGDGAWMFPFPPQGESIAIGEVGVYFPQATDVVVFTYGNGVPMSLRVSRSLEERGLRARVVDLRWISPLPEAEIRRHARDCRAVLVVDECRRSGNVGEAISAVIAEDPELRDRPLVRVTSADSFVPLAAAANLVLLQEDEILEAALRITDRS